MKATIKNDVVIRGKRFAKGEVIEVSNEQFERLQKAGCAEASTVGEKVANKVKEIAKGKTGRIVNREINTGKTRRKRRKSGDKK